MRKSPVYPRRHRFANVAPLVAEFSHAELAEAAGVGENTAKGWRRPDRPDVTIDEETADRLAVRLGLLPTTIWPDFYATLERRCDYEPCSAEFVPWRKDQRFCSEVCRYRWRDAERQSPEERARRAAQARERYATDPHYAQTKRERALEYARSNRRVINAKQRIRYQRQREDISA